MEYWRAAVRLAWRDLQLSRARAALLLAAMAVSVACIGGVRSAANVAGLALQGESRSWLGGDLGVTLGEPLDEPRIDALNRLRSQGMEWTAITTALTMGASSESPDASLMAVKAVDPLRYPLYGGLTIEPAQDLAAALGGDTAVVSKDALARFHVRIGGRILVGGTPFRIAGAIAAEPDRFSGVAALPVRCLLSERGLQRSGIAQSGDAIKVRVLLRLPAGADRDAARSQLRDIFPDGEPIDFRDANRGAVSILETTELSLNLAALVALTLGAIGMAMAVRQHIAERAGTLAVMKTVGGRSRQLTAIFFLQIAGLAAIAFVAGLPLGWGIRGSVLWLASKYVALPPVSPWDFAAVRDTAAAGLVALAPTLVGASLAIGRLKPALLLRRDFAEAPAPGSRAMLSAPWLGVGAVLGAIAVPLLGSWRLTAILIAALAGCIVLAFLAVQALLVGLRRWTRTPALGGAPLLRHGLANLCRPGNRGRFLMVALAIGLVGMITTFQLDRAVTLTIIEAMPFDRPDILISAIEGGLLGEMQAFLERQPGVLKIDIGSQARGRLATADGVRVASLIGCAPMGQSQAIAAAGVARQFGLRVGSRLRFEARGRTLAATVAAVAPMTLVEEAWNGVRMDCRGLDPGSLFYRVAVRVRPDRIAAVRQAIVAEYPAIPVGTADDLFEVVGQMMSDALWLARLVDWYALGSSLAVLAAIVAASRGLRLREMAILSALGAPRRAVVRIYTVEFAAMGLIAGAIGSLLGCGFTVVIVSAVLRDAHAAVEWKSLAAATIVSGGLSVAAGWLPLYGLLRRKPLDILRME